MLLLLLMLSNCCARPPPSTRRAPARAAQHHRAGAAGADVVAVCPAQATSRCMKAKSQLAGRAGRQGRRERRERKKGETKRTNRWRYEEVCGVEELGVPLKICWCAAACFGAAACFCFFWFSSLFVHRVFLCVRFSFGKKNVDSLFQKQSFRVELLAQSMQQKKRTTSLCSTCCLTLLRSSWRGLRTRSQRSRLFPLSKNGGFHNCQWRHGEKAEAREPAAVAVAAWCLLLLLFLLKTSAHEHPCSDSTNSTYSNNSRPHKISSASRSVSKGARHYAFQEVACPGSQVCQQKKDTTHVKVVGKRPAERVDRRTGSEVGMGNRSRRSR